MRCRTWAARGTPRPDSRDRPAAGQGLVEYGLILSGIALVAIVALVFFGDALSAALGVIGGAIDQATR